ncbi:Fic family protein [Boseaceae bacterium BT-24-1]|nr:Fic family protein [Boseaceae bacterium BT-24-1]
MRDPEALDRFERRSVVQRIGEGVPSGQFDLAHLRAIHHHLFQDVYDWAGELRTVEIAKGGNQFQFRRYIGTGMADVHRRIVAGGYLKDLAPADFAARAGEIIGDINYVHPFREGNGRAQALYLEQLALQAGHPLDLRRIVRDEWMAASRAAHAGDYGQFGACIRKAIVAS